METIEYIVNRIDGDYAYLVRIDQSDEEKLVARALLPAEIMEGSHLIYEWLEYRMK
ncbi:MAG: chorismate--pyruvate lyase [Lachnospiraceae bacterium]